MNYVNNNFTPKNYNQDNKMLENCDDSTKKIMNFLKKNPKVLSSLHFATNLSYLVKSLTYIKYLLSFQVIFKDM